MTQKPDYKAAIEYMTGQHYHPRDMMISFYDEVLSALKLADKVTEVVSDEMVTAYLQPRTEICLKGFVNKQFKAMIDQAQKEIEDG
jgi:ferritin-like protein